VTAGVSIFSQASSAVWTLNTGTPNTAYPIANLTDLINICNPFKFTPVANAAEFAFVLPAPAMIQFLAFIRHTISTGTMRVRLWSDNNPDPVGNAAHIVYDSTAVNVWPGGSGGLIAGYSPTRPFLLPAPVTAQSGLITFASINPTSRSIGGFEISQFLPWDISEGAEFGFSTDAPSPIVMGGGDDTPVTNLIRTANGQTDFLSTDISTRASIDFMQTTGLQRPFVFVQEYTDATTWARWCFLARNSSLPPLIGAIFGHDQFQFRLKEFVR